MPYGVRADGRTGVGAVGEGCAGDGAALAGVSARSVNGANAIIRLISFFRNESLLSFLCRPAIDPATEYDVPSSTPPPAYGERGNGRDAERCIGERVAVRLSENTLGVCPSPSIREYPTESDEKGSTEKELPPSNDSEPATSSFRRNICARGAD